ncbi:MAG: hypothetical protein GY758_16170, partial [Fuerstiella sp.]|nr:hypothetical protein [Fuerstiella sp.]
LDLPALRVIDRTVADADRKPLRRFTAVGDAPDLTNQTLPVRPDRPLLAASAEHDGKIVPFNAVIDFAWEDENGQPVDETLVAAAFHSDDGNPPPDVMELFDSNRDGSLDPDELTLNTQAKYDLVSAALIKAGVASPSIRMKVSRHIISHGIKQGKLALSQCDSCHSSEGHTAKPTTLAGTVPVKFSQQDNDPAGLPPGTLAQLDGALVYNPAPAMKGIYLFGATVRMTSVLGLLLFIATIGGIGTHALVRVVLRGRKHTAAKAAAHTSGEPVMMYSHHKRFAHWMLALGMLTLIVTGMKIHFANILPALSYQNAVLLHNLTA